MRDGSWVLSGGRPTTGKKEGLRGRPLLFLEGEPITGEGKGFLRGSSGLLSGGGLTTGEGFSRSDKNRCRGLDYSYCELEGGVLGSPSSRRKRLGGRGDIPKSADA